MQSPPKPPAAADLHAVCGPRYNALAPAADAPADPPAFFRPGDGDARPWVHPDDPAERWDGLA